MVTHFHTRRRSCACGSTASGCTGPAVGARASRAWHEVGSLRVASSRDQWRFLQRRSGRRRRSVSTWIRSRRWSRLTSSLDVGREPLRCDVSAGAMAGSIRAAPRWSWPHGATAWRRDSHGRAGHRDHADRARRRHAVETDHGAIRTECVVNAAHVGWPDRGHGRREPADHALVHQHLPRSRSRERARPHDAVSARPGEPRLHARGGRRVLIGGFERSPVAWSVGGVPGISRNSSCLGLGELFNEDPGGRPSGACPSWRRPSCALVNGPKASRPTAVPARSRAGRARILGGGRPLAHGFGAGGAIGHVLADWLVDGEPSHDVTS